MRHKLPKYINECVTVHPVNSRKRRKQVRPEPTEAQQAITDLLVMAIQERQKLT